MKCKDPAYKIHQYRVTWQCPLCSANNLKPSGVYEYPVARAAKRTAYSDHKVMRKKGFVATVEGLVRWGNGSRWYTLDKKGNVVNEDF